VFLFWAKVGYVGLALHKKSVLHKKSHGRLRAAESTGQLRALSRHRFGIAFAVLERARDVIGFYNLAIGGLLFVAALYFFGRWFLSWEKAVHWRRGKRALVAGTVAVLYVCFFGFQLYQSVMKCVPSSSPISWMVITAAA